jgi:uncharacterized membrane protein YgdD (TMEM256/DUF423 family)
VKIGWSEVWSAAGVIVGLQGATIAHRVHGRGEAAGEDATFLPPAELLSLLSMSVIIFGTFIVPVFLSASVRFAQVSFGLGLLLFAGHVFALAGHYEMFNPASVPKGKRFPMQEQIIVGVVLGLAFIYTILALTRSDI